MVKMLLEIDLNFLLDHKITAHQYTIVKLISDNKHLILKKYLNFTETYDDLPKDLKYLKTAGFLPTTFNPDSYINIEKLKTSSKFVEASTFTSDPFDEFYALFPTKVLRPDGMYDYLRVDQAKCRKLYHNIVRREPSIHEHIVTCLRSEIEDRGLKGQLTYMKRMPAWLTSESWKVYEDHIESDVDTTLEEKRKVYGTDIE